MAKRRLLITGASGFLGWNVCQQALSHWDVVGVVNRHPLGLDGVGAVKCDLANYRELKAMMADLRPDAVIHTAAIANANYCQEHPVETARVNVQSTLNLAGLCSDRELPLAFTSSDLVFDGQNAPYVEDTAVCPVSAYGEQKVLAELGLAECYPPAAICRMALMYGVSGPAGSNYTDSLFAAIAADREIPLFTDEYRTPLSAIDASQGLLLALEAAHGILHLGGGERVSRHEFGSEFCRVLELGARLKACRQADVKLSAPRPPDVSMSIERARGLGFAPRPLADALADLKAASAYEALTSRDDS